MSALYKVMKEKGIHEGTIEQMHRLFAERLYIEGDIPVDTVGRIRIDDLEMREDVQAEVADIWDKLCTDNVYELTDLQGFHREFFQLFGFETEGVDYEADVDTVVEVVNVK
ncbi:putative reductase [compost metagenome]